MDVDELNGGVVVDVQPDGLDPAGDEDEVVELAEVLEEVGVDYKHNSAAHRAVSRGGEAPMVREDTLDGGGVAAVAMSFLQCYNAMCAEKLSQKSELTLRPRRAHVHRVQKRLCVPAGG